MGGVPVVDAFCVTVEYVEGQGSSHARNRMDLDSMNFFKLI